MKKLILLIVAAFAGVSIYGAQEKDTEPEPNPVPIVRGDYTDQTKIQPRSMVPITCYFCGEEVVLNFMDDLGEVEVTVVSLGTGEQWFLYGDAADGELRISTTTESGNYVVQIHAVDGGSWHGCFTR